MAVIEGTAYWASVTTPNTNYEPVYTVNLIVESDTAKKFKREGYSVKQMDEGPAIVIKRKVTSSSGKTNPPPKLFDKYKNPLDLVVGNGSKVKVQYKPWETVNKYGSFKGLDFQAMQVIELVGSDADGAEFNAMEEDVSLEEQL